MLLINNNENLLDFCNILKKQDYITVDSEFIREHSYYPELCLIQVACDEQEAIIDPLSSIDLSPFFEILQDEKIVKVFHAARQDIEIFYNLTGHTPKNLFDTQIAAMVCGYPDYIGYGNLVEDILHVDLDKSRRLTDWSIRPLDEAQLQYAICDVTYLRDCYKHLKKYMEEYNRTEWVDEEISSLCDERCYNIDPDECWCRIKHNAHTPIFLSALKYLAAWRENRAQKYNTPRSSILKDEVLVNIASTMPKSVNELSQVRNIKSEIVKGKLGAEIMDVLQKAVKNPMPHDICKADRKQGFHIPSHEQSLMEMLKMLLKIKSQEEGVSAKLVAGDEDLRYIIIKQPEKTHSMRGWRYDVFGKYAEQLCNGNLVVQYNPKKKKIEFTVKE